MKSRLVVGQRVMLVDDCGKFFPAGSKGTVVEDVTGKRIGRQDQLVPMGHCYRVAFDHRQNMPAMYIYRNSLTKIDKQEDCHED